MWGSRQTLPGGHGHIPAFISVTSTHPLMSFWARALCLKGQRSPLRRSAREIVPTRHSQFSQALRASLFLCQHRKFPGIVQNKNSCPLKGPCLHYCGTLVFRGCRKKASLAFHSDEIPNFTLARWEHGWPLICAGVGTLECRGRGHAGTASGGSKFVMAGKWESTSL